MEVIINPEVVCPRCGNPKSRAAKTCRDCYAAIQEEEAWNRPLKPLNKNQYDVCSCGKRKDKRAKMCKECWSVSPQHPFRNGVQRKYKKRSLLCLNPPTTVSYGSQRLQRNIHKNYNI